MMNIKLNNTNGCIAKSSSIEKISHQHGFKHKHSTDTALHNICNQITRGFNNPRPQQCTAAVGLDMSKAFEYSENAQTHSNKHS